MLALGNDISEYVNRVILASGNLLRAGEAADWHWFRSWISEAAAGPAVRAFVFRRIRGWIVTLICNGRPVISTPDAAILPLAHVGENGTSRDNGVVAVNRCRQRVPKPELTLHLPLSWFSEHAPHAVYRINGEERLELDYRALREMISPSFLVFDALTKLGYDVSAAVAESKAMRHVMIEQAWALKEITKYVGVKDKASIRISI